jgi:hypothetical protein
MSTTRHSPAPWGYEYSPYTVRNPGIDTTSTVGDERKRSQANCMVICGSVVVAGSACNSILDKRRAALG